MKHSHGGDKLVAAVAAAFGQGYERPAARREWPSEAPREPSSLPLLPVASDEALARRRQAGGGRLGRHTSAFEVTRLPLRHPLLTVHAYRMFLDPDGRPLGMTLSASRLPGA